MSTTLQAANQQGLDIRMTSSELSKSRSQKSGVRSQQKHLTFGYVHHAVSFSSRRCYLRGGAVLCPAYSPAGDKTRVGWRGGLCITRERIVRLVARVVLSRLTTSCFTIGPAEKSNPASDSALRSRDFHHEDTKEQSKMRKLLSVF